MKAINLELMSVEELWTAHEQIKQALIARIRSEQHKLRDQLARLRSGTIDIAKAQPATRIVPSGKKRRPYPRVMPKYQSLKNPSETWSGRGKRPKWMVAELKNGKSISDFLIEKTESKQKAKRQG